MRRLVGSGWPTTLAVVAACLGGAVPGARAQSEVQFWSEAGVRYEASEALRLEGALLMRLDRDLSRLSLLGPGLGASYRLGSGLRLGGGYRFEWRRIGGELRSAHRFHVQLGWRKRLGALRLGYRLRLQERVRDRPSGQGDVRGSLRQRLGLALRKGTARPFVHAELFTGLHGRKAALLQKLRATLGVSMPLDPVSLEAYYRLQVPFVDPDDPLEHILGVGLEWTIERDEPADEGA